MFVFKAWKTVDIILRIPCFHDVSIVKIFTFFTPALKNAVKSFINSHTVCVNKHLVVYAYFNHSLPFYIASTTKYSPPSLLQRRYIFGNSSLLLIRFWICNPILAIMAQQIVYSRRYLASYTFHKFLILGKLGY